MSYTLAYSQGTQGWVSFYSFYPEWMIGMNNFFYTFKGGNIYRHNSNQSRNTFYYEWWDAQGTPQYSFVSSRIVSVLNQSVLENKLFKTIALEGDDSWSGTFKTDLQDSGYIQSNFFEKKEATYFAFIRNDSNGQLSLRSVNGIGNSLTVTNAGTKINFSITPLVSIGNIISIGDLLYFGNPLVLVGKVTQINVNYPAGINQLVIDTTIPGTTPIVGNVHYFAYIKNSIAESHGVLGHYCVFDMTNGSSNKVELFAVRSEVMKSFP